jgi:hypothetical protein
LYRHWAECHRGSLPLSFIPPKGGTTSVAVRLSNRV